MALKVLLRFLLISRISIFSSLKLLILSSDQQIIQNNCIMRLCSGKQMAVIVSYFKDETYGIMGPQMGATIIQDHTLWSA
jgi:hypothetical protein